jgi:hypothetical protein
MKQDAQELVAVQNTVKEAEFALVDLQDLQLALVGGGTGEVVIA